MDPIAKPFIFLSLYLLSGIKQAAQAQNIESEEQLMFDCVNNEGFVTSEDFEAQKGNIIEELVKFLFASINY